MIHTGNLADFYNGKRVFITGHTGFKGSWMCEALLSMGAEVTGYALEPPTSPSAFEKLGLSDRIKGSVTGDIRDLAHLRKTLRETSPEVVIHMAAQPIVRQSYRDPVGTYETNVMGTVNILESIRNIPSVRSFVNVTTDKVYRNEERKEGYREEEYLDGYDPYSNSKSCSELVTSSYRNSFFSEAGACAISTCRAGNVIGGGDFAPDRIIPDCVRSAAAGEDIVIRNPASVRPFQHVLEPVMAYLLVAAGQYERPELAGAYNVGPEYEDCLTAGALADLFCEKWNSSVRSDGNMPQARWVIRSDGGPHEAGLLRLDSGKIKRVFGWSPVWNIDGAIEKTVEWSLADLRGEDMAKVTGRQIRDYVS